MRRFFVNPDCFDGRRAVIGGNDARHIRNVLRMVPGQPLELTDGVGILLSGRIETIDAEHVVVAVEGSRTGLAPPLHLTLAQGYLKDDKMDLVLRQATELGMARWQPFWASRSVARPAAPRLAGRMARWEKIAREAVKQCRRDIGPQIGGPVGYAQMLALGTNADLKIVFWEQTPVPFYLGPPGGARPRSIWIVLGPEGGLTGPEVENATRLGYATAGLGPRILRAETAALAACTLVQHCFGDLGPGGTDEKTLDKALADQ